VFEALGSSIGIVNFTGGQPTMKTDAADIMLSAAKLLARLELMHYTTNALTPDADTALLEKVLTGAPRVITRVSLSLDGLNDGHDGVRGVSGNFAKAETLFKQCKELKRRFSNLRAGFSTTIGTFNAGALKELAAAFPDKDFHTFDFYHANSEYYGEAPREPLALDAAGKARAAAELLHGLPKGIDALLNRIFLALSGKQPLPCAAGEAAVSLFPAGEVKRCYFLKESIGNIRAGAYDLPAIMRAARPKLNEECRLCWNTCNAYATIAARPLAAGAGWLRAR
jgi:MoaA/NifB/PqqE/SkfB family radical SAM enzyme